MKAFTIQSKDLAVAFSLALETVESKTTLPVLAFVRLDSADAHLRITATDLNSSAITTIPATCDEPLSILTHAHKTNDLIRLINGPITFREQKGVLSVVSGDSSRYRLPTMALGLFPVIDVADGPETAIPGALLASLLSAVAFAAETNPNGEDRWKALELIAGEGQLSVTACCGPRLANATAPFDGKFHILLPRRHADLLSKFALRHETLSLVSNSNLLTATSGDDGVTVRLSAYQWPDWKPLIQPEYDFTVEFDAATILAALKRSLTACEDRLMVQRVTFELSQDKATLTTVGPDQSEGREHVAIIAPALNGSTVTMALAGNQLMDYLRKAEGIVTLQYKDGAPIRLTAQDSTLQYLQLPLRK